MSDKIEIDVKINGKTARLSDISDETLANLKKAEQPKSIKHGDYGYTGMGQLLEPRLFVEIGGVIAAYNSSGSRCNRNVNAPVSEGLYTVKGNIFDDIKDGRL